MKNKCVKYDNLHSLFWQNPFFSGLWRFSKSVLNGAREPWRSNAAGRCHKNKRASKTVGRHALLAVPSAPHSLSARQMHLAVCATSRKCCLSSILTDTLRAMTTIVAMESQRCRRTSLRLWRRRKRTGVPRRPKYCISKENCFNGLRRAPHNAYAWPPWIVGYNVPHGFVIKSLLPSASAAFGNTNRWTLQEANDPKVGWRKRGEKKTALYAWTGRLKAPI